MIPKFVKKLIKFLNNHPEILILSITTLIALFYFSLGVNSWKFSFVGDEWPFYTLAKTIADKNFIINPFSFQGVYNQNSLLASLYQAIFIKISYSNFAWRFSNIILIIPITIFFFLWVKGSFNKKIALISTLILQSSFYLANFFKIGNIMPQALALSIICLYYSKKAGENPNIKNVALLGLLLGISFYVYIGPLFPFIIWPYLISWFSKKYSKKDLIQNFIFLMVPFLLLLSPALHNIFQWSGPADKTILHKEYTNNLQILINIFHNFLLFYKNYDYLYNHFVAGPYLDIITRLFALIGSMIFIIRIRKRQYLFLLLSYISVCVIIGITSPYSYAPTTRGLFFLPFGFVFAGIGVSDLDIRLKNPKFLILFILLFIFILNFYQSQIGVFKISGYTKTGLVMETLQAVHKKSSTKNVTLILSDINSYNYQNIYLMQQAYGLFDLKLHVSPANNLNCSEIKNDLLLVFSDDAFFISGLLNHRCPKTFSPKILHPSIAL